MKVLLIHGQNHQGSTCHIGRLIVEQIEQKKEVAEFFLPRDLNHFCMGCYQCIEGDEKCPFYEEKHTIMEAVEKADILIFTTPTYCLRASAPMKAFLDLTFTYWMSHRPRQSMFSKRAVVVSTAAGSGANKATKDIATALFYWGVPDVISYGMVVQAMSWEQVSDKKKARLKKDTAKIAKRISNHKKPHVGLKTRFIFKIMAMMQKGGMGSSPLEKEYWEKNGWLSNKRPWRER